jgi:hypothetical protein
VQGAPRDIPHFSFFYFARQAIAKSQKTIDLERMFRKFEIIIRIHFKKVIQDKVFEIIQFKIEFFEI